MCPARGEYTAIVTYSQAHLRLKNDKGRPDQHDCVACAQPAREWAYMGDCPQELTDELGRVYSLDPARYEPMCVPCHRRHDRAAADGRSADVCPRGHAWTEENTGLRVKRSPGVGLRFCRACHRENSRAYRLKKRAA